MHACQCSGGPRHLCVGVRNLFSEEDDLALQSVRVFTVYSLVGRYGELSNESVNKGLSGLKINWTR